MIKLRKTLCNEELVYRLPTLFPYIDYDENGEVEYHKATDTNMGSYGKFMTGLNVSSIANFVVSSGVNGGITITNKRTFKQRFNDYLNSENVSLRTLLNIYYKLKKSDEELTDIEKALVAFVEYGIGKTNVSDSITGSLVPNYVYLSQVVTLLDDMKHKQKTVNKYLDKTDKTEAMCCFIEEYNERGGDAYVNFLSGLIAETLDRANNLFGLVKNNVTDDDKDYVSSFSFSVMLTNHYKDNGYFTPYTNIWIPGQKLSKHEIFTYTDEEGFTDTYVAERETSGLYDEITMSYKFDSSAMTKLISYKCNGDDEECKFETRLRERIKMRDTNDLSKWDLKTASGEEDIETEYYEVGGFADSKLKSLRRSITYLNSMDQPETPSDTEDWLFYYRKGLVTNYRTSQDEDGNILFIPGSGNTELTKVSDEEREIGGKVYKVYYVTNLLAYGDCITDITANAEERTITFEYILGAHLYCVLLIEKASGKINRTTRSYSDFLVDTDSEYGKYSGVKYTETFSYSEGSEIDSLISDSGTITFNDYIESYSVNNKRYAFSTSNSKQSSEMLVGYQITPITYNSADFTAKTKNFADNLYMFHYKEPQLDGIHYKPIVENNVFLTRGNNSAFERHIRLGSINTIDDFNSVQNGGFFGVKTSY